MYKSEKQCVEYVYLATYHMALVLIKPVFGIGSHANSKPVCSAIETN